MHTLDTLQDLLDEALRRQQVVQQAQAELKQIQDPLVNRALALADTHRELFEPLYKEQRRLDRTQPSYEDCFGETPSCQLRDVRWAVEGDNLCIRGNYPQGDWVEYVCRRIPLRYFGADASASMAAAAEEMQGHLQCRADAQRAEELQAQQAAELALLHELQKKWGNTALQP